MAYTEKCTGTYIGKFTMFDPVKFNNLLSEGHSIQEATKMLKTSNIIFGSAFYPLYSYTVNGVEYVRASYRLREHFGQSAGHANMWMEGKRCTVWYDPENPGDAVVEDKSGVAEAKDVVPGAQKKASMKWIWFAVGALVVLGLVQTILHAIFFMRG